MFNSKAIIRIFKFLCLLACAVSYFYLMQSRLKVKIRFRSAPFNYTNKRFCDVRGCIDDNIDFEGFDNRLQNLTEYIVPNIIHLVYINKTEMKFPELVATLSMYLHHKPDYIYFHCNNCSFTGKYWEKIQRIENLRKIIRLKPIKFLGSGIFGNKATWIQHRTDTLRLNLLMNYGGIYMDADLYVIKPLHQFRKHEITLSWKGENHEMGNQLFIAHKNARLLRAFADIYRYNYTKHVWYWNAGFYPGTLLFQHRNNSLANVVNWEFGTLVYTGELYRRNESYIEDFHTIHLMYNHRSYLDSDSPIKEFDDENIKNYTSTFGKLARKVLNAVDYYNL